MRSKEKIMIPAEVQLCPCRQHGVIIVFGNTKKHTLIHFGCTSDVQKTLRTCGHPEKDIQKLIQEIQKQGMPKTSFDMTPPANDRYQTSRQTNRWCNSKPIRPTLKPKNKQQEKSFV